jgi:hypothetical protein
VDGRPKSGYIAGLVGRAVRPILQMRGLAMPKHFVNLDALIIREDFEVTAETSQPRQMSGDLKLPELGAQAIPYKMLRKPDFQRETSRWTSDKIVDLIQSFVDGDLIPSIILWRSATTGNIFVIDGAHRLSALIAWVHDDYGDREVSLPFYDNAIPEDQKDAAEETRRLIASRIGSYEEILRAGKNPTHFPQPQVLRAQNASMFKIDLQWVAGDARNAEKSFFKINQQATPIDPTELLMIESRRKPNAIAARALLHAGVGHKYWSAFPEKTQDKIESLAGEIYETLFTPPLDQPIKTLDLPVAGKGYSHDSVKLTFEFVNFANGLRTEKSWEPSNLKDDVDGEQTLSYLKKVQSLTSMITGTAPGSLGLHPAVYFYGATGRYQPSAFLATVQFIQDLDGKRALRAFTDSRERFEEFLVAYKEFTNQIIRTYGGGARSLEALVDMYDSVLGGVKAGRSNAAIIEGIKAINKLKFVQEITEDDRKQGKNFSRETKSTVFLKEALQTALRCKICGARIHVKSISFDHIERKQDGGTGTTDNAQMTHPYCNSGYKEGAIAAEKKAAREPAG